MCSEFARIIYETFDVISTANTRKNECAAGHHSAKMAERYERKAYTSIHEHDT